LKWSTLPNCRSVDCTRHEGTVDELAEFIKKERGDSKDGEAICGAIFKGDRRSLSNVESVAFLMLDFDDCIVDRPSEALGLLKNYTLIAHSSHSHGLPGSFGMRFRVFVPLARPVTVEEYSVLWAHIHRKLEHKPDAACKDASRLNFLRRTPNPSSTEKSFFHYQKAETLDPDTLGVGALVENERIRIEERRLRQADLVKWREENAGTDHEWIDSALHHVSPRDYHIWRDVGMALKRAGEEDGLRGAYSIWDVWSVGSDKYDARTSQKIWDSFRGAGPSGAVTLGTIWHLASNAGWTPPQRTSKVVDLNDLWGEEWGDKIVERPPSKKEILLKSESDHYLCGYALDMFGVTKSRVCWDGNTWQVYNERTGCFEEEENSAYKVIDGLHGCQIDAPPKIGKDGKEVIVTKYLDSKHSRCASVEAKARIVAHRPTFHEHRPRGLAFSDGFFCSVKGEMLPHSPAHRATVSMGISYPAHDDAPVWDRVLRETLGEGNAQTFQEYLGLCMLGRATEFQRALFLTGHGANGKSTIVDAATRCFPDESICHVSPHHLSSQKSEYHIMEIRGRLINVVAEVSDRELRDASAYKSLVSGDPTSGRPPFGQVCRFRPIAGHVFICNRLPSTSDSSDGFWRRAIVIDFAKQFTGSNDDITLPFKLRAEKSGITHRIIQAGLNAIERGSIAISDASVESAQEWRINSTPVLAFLLEVAEHYDVRQPFADVYKKYKSWAEENGRGVMNSTNFGLELQAQGCERIRSNGTFYDFTAFITKHGLDTLKAPF